MRNGWNMCGGVVLNGVAVDEYILIPKVSLKLCSEIRTFKQDKYDWNAMKRNSSNVQIK